MRKKALRHNIILILSVLITSCSSVVNTRVIEPKPTPAITPLTKNNTANNTANVDPSVLMDEDMPVVASNSDGDLWASLRGDFKMEHDDYNPAVQEEIQWYENHQKRLNQALTNSAPYLYYIYQQVQARHLPGEYVLLPIMESAYDPFATSYAGATGLWQLMPETANGFGLTHNYWYDGSRDVYASTQAALNYISYLGGFFNGDWDLATAAYNSGEGTVQRAIQINASRGQQTDFWHLPLPRQTEQYVPELLALAIIIDDPSRYGVTLPAIKNGPYFTAVSVDTEIDMSHIAQLADTNVNDLVQLNSGYSHDVTDPHMLNRILLPLDKLEIFKENLANYEADLLHHPEAANTTAVQTASSDNNATEQASTQYTIRHGDTLAAIARRYHTSVLALVEANHIRHDAIRPGQTITIPGTMTASASDAQAAPDNEATQASATSASSSTAADERNTVSADTAQSSVTDNNSETATTSYTIQRGDNLWSIAKKFGVTTSQIRAANHIRSERDLRVGVVITIPQNGIASKITNTDTNYAKTDVSSYIEKSQQKTTPTAGPKTYRIRSGDTLSSIAAKFGVTIHELRVANNLYSNNLHIGHSIIIPG